MDPYALVEGGADGLRRIADAFRARGISVVGIYLIKLTTHDGAEEWVLRLVSGDKDPDLNGRMIKALVELDRARALPRIDPYVRFHIAPSDDPEASRVVDYAQRLGGAPVLIRDAMAEGLFIEYALVGMVPDRDAAAAA